MPDITLQNLLTIVFAVIVSFFAFAYILMYSYNESIAKMNKAWNPITYQTSLMFSLFIVVVTKLFIFSEQI
jgi:hypothetical protein